MERRNRDNRVNLSGRGVMDGLARAEDRFVPEGICRQIDAFLTPLMQANEIRPQYDRREISEYDYIRHNIMTYVAERNARALEINTPEYQDVVRLADSIIPVKTFGVDCMDERDDATRKFGFSAKISGIMRVPAANIKEFIRGVKQKIELLKNSKFAQVIDALCERNNIFAEVINSHLGCAARKLIEEENIGELEDDGLLRDVLEKRQMADAMREYVATKYGDEKTVLPIQTSFDPHSGFIYMGLETDEALDFAVQSAQGAQPVYSKAVRKELVASGKVLSTRLLAFRLSDIFNQYQFKPDWNSHYKETAINFWNNIAAMKDIVLPAIKSEVLKVYGHLNTDSEIAQKELEERAVLLLTNAYSGFLHNPHGVVEVESDDGHEDHGYQHGEHNGVYIATVENIYGPYPTPNFVVSNYSMDEVSERTRLAMRLIRGNRKAGRTIDASGIFEDQDRFEKVSVTDFMVQINRGMHPEHYRRILENVDWSDLPKDWDEMNTREFSDYFIRIAQRAGLNFVPGELIISLDELREKMKIVCSKESSMSRAAVDQNLVVVPVLVGANRQVLGIVPFIKTGYSN
ncbi:MAG: hypothetical protein M1450_03580 [Patescibacteria group bacterium]|nr:hypothetical protein [Patescibacteria group bacterium]